MTYTCFLSGLEIPKGSKSVDHYFPKCLIPKDFHTNRNNTFPAHKIINEIKGCLKPCVWEEQKFDRVYFAISHYNIRQADKEFCRKTLDNWEEYRINPCVWCIMNDNCKRR